MLLASGVILLAAIGLGLTYLAFEADSDGVAAISLIGAILSVVLIIGIVASLPRLCVKGHEEWQTTTQAPVIVGDVIIPGTTTTAKVWVCTEYELPR